MNREDLIQEIRWSLPDKKLLDVVNFGAIKLNGELVVLKSREGFIPQDTIRYDKPYKPFVQKEDIAGIQGKNVVFSPDTFSRRGLLAMAKLSNLMMEEVLNDEFI
ncbi:hypothetical protein Kirov_220 [Bacillus phage Kirov]|uniref:Uncharacterized protein n=1 Tax=Bacillus phage Kirov TaxID=2783539 RepID=A0A7U3RXS4_9CAUD|nr:hypothetical protein PQE67_gp084 [Bacillus phage Kirov]QOV08419.1 hypothetical protein Kirov_220 [Bacillus phage Kirov]